jgi:opacity protein-like surface antigen
MIHAQESKSEKIFRTFRFSLFLGPTINSLKPTAESSENYDITKEKGNIGFSFGLGADYNINERYTVYSGLGMDWRGGTLNTVKSASFASAGINDSAKYLKSALVKYRMQYLTIPLGLKMKAAQFDKIKIYAQTGLDLGLLLSQKGDYTFQFNDTITPSVSKTKQKLGGYATVVPINLGWCIGVGAEYDLNDKNSVYGAILYRNGFVDATTPKTNDAGVRFSDGNIRSNSVMIRIGYFF